MTLSNTLKKINEIYDNVFNNKSYDIAPNLNNQLKNLENLFIDTYSRKKKEGAYYTGNDIAKFIVEKTIKCYFNRYGTTEDKLSNNINKQIPNICDPATGAGIFLTNSANLIYKTLLKNNLIDLHDSNLKLQILEKIYGYDVNPYAIKLTRLNLFSWFFDKDFENNLTKAVSILKSNIKVKNLLAATKNSIHKLTSDKCFDIIISNPPYGNILDDETKTILERNGIITNDIYCSFLAKSLDWGNGIHSYLIPKSFLLRQNYIAFRNEFLRKANLLKLFDLGSDFFKSATNEVQVLIFENKNKIKVKKNNTDMNLLIKDYPNKFINLYKNQKFDKLNRCSNQNCPKLDRGKNFYPYTFKERCDFCGGKTEPLNRIRIKPTERFLKIILLIEENGNLNYLNIKDYPRMIRGEEAEGLRAIKQIIENNVAKSCYFINAKNDVSYYFYQKRKSFNIEEISPIILKGSNYEYYTRPKLLIKHNNIVPEAIITEENTCFTSSIYSLLDDNYTELRFICACLNSLPIQFYCYFGINNQKDTTINLNQYMIRHLPIPDIDLSKKELIASKVKNITEILDKNNNNLNGKVKAYLQEIDTTLMDLFSIKEDDRILMTEEIKNRIEWFNKIYN